MDFHCCLQEGQSKSTEVAQSKKEKRRALNDGARQAKIRKKDAVCLSSDASSKHSTVSSSATVSSNNGSATNTPRPTSSRAEAVLIAAGPAPNVTTASNTPISTSTSVLSTTVLTSSIPRSTSAMKTPNSTATNVGPVLTATPPVPDAASATSTPTRRSSRAKNATNSSIQKFSWDNPDVHGMIDRYVKATYLPHLGVKTQPLESSAHEIALIIETRYHIDFSRHAVRCQLEKHRRLIAPDVTIPVVSFKRKRREADTSPASVLTATLPVPIATSSSNALTSTATSAASTNAGPLTSTPTSPSTSSASVLTAALPAPNATTASNTPISTSTSVLSTTVLTSSIPRSTSAMKTPNSTATNVGPVLTATPPVPDAASATSTPTRRSSRAKNATNSSIQKFSWDNPDVHGMIDRYVKATYLPHLGVKTQPLESSAHEIALIIKTRYHVNLSQHAVCHQFEKHRRLITSDVTTPVNSRERGADTSPAVTSSSNTLTSTATSASSTTIETSAMPNAGPLTSTPTSPSTSSASVLTAALPAPNATTASNTPISTSTSVLSTTVLTSAMPNAAPVTITLASASTSFAPVLAASSPAPSAVYTSGYLFEKEFFPNRIDFQSNLDDDVFPSEIKESSKSLHANTSATERHPPYFDEIVTSLSNQLLRAQNTVQNLKQCLQKYRDYEKDVWNSQKSVCRQPFSELTSSGKTKAASRILSRLQEMCPSYTQEDWLNMFQIMFPDVFTSVHPMERFTAGHTLKFMFETNATFRLMDQLRSSLDEAGFPVFASKREVNKLRETLNVDVSSLNLLDADGQYVHNAYITDVEEALRRRIREQKASGQFRTSHDRSIALCLTIDKGGGSTKLGCILSTLANRNTPAAMLLLALYNGDEDRRLMHNAFSPILRVFEELKEITVDDETHPVVVFFTADCKCLKCFLGVKCSTCRRPCSWCPEPVDFVFGGLPPEGKDDVERDFTQVDDSLSQEALPLMNIDRNHIVLPGMHLLMGMASRFLGFISAALCRFDYFQANGTVEGFVPPVFDDEVETALEVIKQCDADNIENVEVCQRWKSLRRTVAFATEKDFDIDTTIIDDLICSSEYCLVKLTGEELPERDSAIDEFTCPITDTFYHTACVGALAKDCPKSSENSETTKTPKPPKLPKATPKPKATSVLAVIDEEIQVAERNVISTLRKLNAARTKVATKRKAVEDSPSCKKLYKKLESFGADRRAWYQDFTGTHIRRILANASKITAALTVTVKGEVQQIADLVPEVKDGLRALELLGRVQDYTCAKKLSVEDIYKLEVCVDHLRHHLRTTTLSTLLVGHKSHIVLNHMVPSAQRWTTVNYFTEQSIESMHADVNRKLRRIKTRKTTEQLQMVLKWAFEVNLIKDKYGRSTKVSKEKRTAPDRQVIGDSGEVPAFFELECKLKSEHL